jgi:hypothetical protein
MWITDNVLYVNAPEYPNKEAQLSIYNMTGQIIMKKVFVVGELSIVDLGSIKSGAVVARLTINGNVLTTKGILVQR